MKDNWFLERLVEAVNRLAASAEAQINYLKTIKTWPSLDELGLEYHDAALHAGKLLRAGLITAECHLAIIELDEKLASFGGEENAEEWSAPALKISKNWSEVRSRAMKVADLLR